MLSSRCKYQIFISSTFADLQEEREYVSWEILKMRHIPAGMESFTARNERGWKTIQRTIDDSDYYVLLLAGRYGSIHEEWKQSWTHREYDYALSKGVHVLAFVRDWNSISADKTDADRTRIDGFRTIVQACWLYAPWKQKEDLASLVSTSLTAQITDDIEEGRARPGWYRGDALPGPSTEVTDELARLSAENSRLRQEVETARMLSNSSSRNLEIEKSIDYLRSRELEPGISLYEVLLLLSDNLALGINERGIRSILQALTQLSYDQRTIFTISSQFRMAGVIKIERERLERGEYQRGDNIFFLTELGIALVLDARSKNVPLPKKLTSSRHFVFGRSLSPMPAAATTTEPPERDQLHDPLTDKSSA